jgi:hypothetical protein
MTKMLGDPPAFISPLVEMTPPAAPAKIAFVLPLVEKFPPVPPKAV